MANRVGQKVNRLLITEQSGLYSTALCDCGRYITTTTYNITSGRAASCGCFRKAAVRKKNTTHGYSGTPTWYSWIAMRTRCNNPNRHNSKNYFEKGITYPKEWDVFSDFVADMGERPEGTTLDRRDSEKGYSKENCRWATSREQWENRDDPRIEVHRKNREAVAELEELLKDLS